MENLDSAMALLTWLMTSTGAGWLFSWIAEKVPAWGELPSEAKKLYSQLGIVVIGLSVYFLIPAIPHDVLAAIDPVFKFVVGLLSADALVQGYHKINK